MNGEPHRIYSCLHTFKSFVEFSFKSKKSNHYFKCKIHEENSFWLVHFEVANNNATALCFLCLGIVLQNFKASIFEANINESYHERKQFITKQNERYLTPCFLD